MKLGLRGVSDPRVIGYYSGLVAPSQEFARKVRTLLRGLTVIFRHTEFLNGFSYGLFSYQYFCHKLLRWLVLFFLLGAVLSSVVLAQSSTFFFYPPSCSIIILWSRHLGWATQALKRRFENPHVFSDCKCGYRSSLVSVFYWKKGGVLDAFTVLIIV